MRVQPASKDEVARLWQPVGEGDAAPAHLLLCSPVDDSPGPEVLLTVLETALRDGLPATAPGLSVFALLGGATAEEGAAAAGLPPPRLRRRVTSLLPAAPAPATVVAALELAATRLPPLSPSVAPGSSPDSEAAAALRLPTATTPGRSGLRVLVADDNQVNRRVVEKILERSGHQATLVGNGEEALDALAADHFDVALMDVNMPVLNGIEATKLHRFASLGQRHVPIIGLTADASPATAERCREAGMDACLTKPVEPARLSEVVEAHGRPVGAKPVWAGAGAGLGHRLPPRLPQGGAAAARSAGAGQPRGVGRWRLPGRASRGFPPGRRGERPGAGSRSGPWRRVPLPRRGACAQERRGEHRRQVRVARLSHGRGPPCSRSAEHRPLARGRRAVRARSGASGMGSAGRNKRLGRDLTHTVSFRMPH